MRNEYQNQIYQNARLRLISEADQLGVPPERQQDILRLFGQVFRTRPIKHTETVTISANLIAFRLFLRRSDTPSLSLARFACRMVHQYSNRVQCDLVLNAIANSTTPLQDLQALKAEFLKIKERRERNAIKSAAYRDTIRQFLSHVNYPFQAPFVEFKNSNNEIDSFEASTDGKRIFLPHVINVDEGNVNSEINILILIYLAFHEMQHWGIYGARGTYDFSFDTEEGAALLDRLRNRSSMFKQNRERWDGEVMFRQILQEEGIEAPQEQAALTHLQALTLFHSNPRLVHWIMNLFEDLRIDAQAQLCGMGELQSITKRFLSRSLLHHSRNTPPELFLMHLVAAVQDPGLSLPKPQAYQTILDPVLRIIEEYRSIPFHDKSPETSANYVWRVLEVIEQHPNHESLTRNNRILQVTSLTEIMIRRQIMGLAESQTQHGRGGRPHLSTMPEKSVESSNKVDEFDYHEAVVKKEAVAIRKERFKPWRTPLPEHRLAGFRSFRTPSKTQRKSSHPNGLILSHTGTDLSVEAAVSFLAEARTGRKPRHGVYFERGRNNSRTHVSILIDLTVSMEQRKPNLPALPMQMVIDAVSRIADSCKRSKTQLDIWGVHDGGRQPVTLFQVAPQDISRIHAVAVGGARLGAALRYLNKQQKYAAQDRHLVLMMTDGAPMYLKTGHDELVGGVKKSCRFCQLRAFGHKGCHVETEVRLNTSKEQWGLHMSADYQYADIVHAIQSSPPGTTVRYIEFIDKPFDGLLDNYLGKNWLACNGELDLSKIFFATAR